MTFLRLLLVLLLVSTIRAADAAPLATLAPHPRLLVTDDDLRRIRAAPADALRTRLKNHLYAMATKAGDGAIESAAVNLARFHRENPVPTENDWRGLGLRNGRRVQGQLFFWALASRVADVVDGDPVRSKTWGQRAIRQMMAVAAPDYAWDPGRGVVLPGRTTSLNGQFLNVAEMAFGVAIAYDWLCSKADWWLINGVDQRPVVARALYEKALLLGRDAYGTGPGTPSSYTNFWVNGRYNWTQVCNGGMVAAALALAGETRLAPGIPAATIDAEATRTLDGACASLERAQSMYAPAGVYPEGLGYWSYGTGYQTLAIALLESALGAAAPFVEQRVRPLWDHPGLRATSQFRVALVGPTGLGFSYADTGYQPGQTSRTDDPSVPLTWLTRRFGQTDLLAVNRRNLERDSLAIPTTIDDTTFYSTHAYPLHYAWLPPPATATIGSGIQDIRFTGKPLEGRQDNTVALSILRNSGTDPASWWVALKGGASGLGHSHGDLGSFSLDVAGLRWADDLGADDYGLPGYGDDDDGGARWNYLLCGVQGHNVMSPGGRQQAIVAQAPITGFSSTTAGAWSTIDLTDIYPGTARRIVRGIELIDQRQQVLVQDDVQGLQPGLPLLWRMMTAASVVRDAADPRGATLTRTKGRTTVTMRLEVLHPADATIGIESVASIQNGVADFPGYQRITVRVPPRGTVGDAQVVVRLRQSTRAATTVALPRAPAWSWLPAAGSPQQAPVVTSRGFVGARPGAEFTYAITATDGPLTGWVATGLPSWLRFDATAGRLTGVVPADLTDLQAMTVGATNATGTGTTTLTIGPAEGVLPVLTTQTIQGRVGVAMAAVNLITNGGANPLYLPPQSLRVRGLPPGLQVSDRGRLSGQPTVPGSYAVELAVQNLYGEATAIIPVEILSAAGSAPPTLTATPRTVDLP